MSSRNHSRVDSPIDAYALEYRRRVGRVGREQFRVIGVGADAKDSGRRNYTERFARLMAETADTVTLMLESAEKALGQTVGAREKVRTGVLVALVDNLEELEALRDQVDVAITRARALLEAEPAIEVDVDLEDAAVDQPADRA